jgi:hypothetical protein
MRPTLEHEYDRILAQLLRSWNTLCDTYQSGLSREYTRRRHHTDACNRAR